MSGCVIFSGPTLPAATIARWLPKSEVRPPAACGDVYRALAAGAVVIGILDAQVDQVRALWHRELLWALKHGVYVYGAAGAGALRAAELHSFGMIGVGRIFGWYRDGELDADDEVLVAHAPAEAGYRVASESLVNIRATLERAVSGWVLSEAGARALIQVARSQFYPTRTYPSLLERARQQGSLAPALLARVADWLASGSEARVHQQRIDAEAMVRRIASARHDARCQPRPFEFQSTHGWHELTRRIDAEGQLAARASG